MTYCILLDLALWQLCPLPYSINLYYYPQGLSRVVPHRVKGNTRLAPVCAFEKKKTSTHDLVATMSQAREPSFTGAPLPLAVSPSAYMSYCLRRQKHPKSMKPRAESAVAFRWAPKLASHHYHE